MKWYIETAISLATDDLLGQLGPTRLGHLVKETEIIQRKTIAEKIPSKCMHEACGVEFVLSDKPGFLVFEENEDGHHGEGLYLRCWHCLSFTCAACNCKVGGDGGDACATHSHNQLVASFCLLHIFDAVVNEWVDRAAVVAQVSQSI